jgi:hypothetical protein
MLLAIGTGYLIGKRVPDILKHELLAQAAVGVSMAGNLDTRLCAPPMMIAAFVVCAAWRVCVLFFAGFVFINQNSVNSFSFI